MNQAATFGLLGVGGIAIVKALTGSSFADVVKGHPGSVATTGSVLTSGVAGAGAAIAGASATAVNAATGVGGVVAGDVKSGDLTGLAAAHNWGANDIAAWAKVIVRESGGRLTAKNPSSGAYGIAQGITGPSWYADHGGNADTVIGQLTAMANYISQRYGTPSAAWAHEQSFGWY